MSSLWRPAGTHEVIACIFHSIQLTIHSQSLHFILTTLTNYFHTPSAAPHWRVLPEPPHTTKQTDNCDFNPHHIITGQFHLSADYILFGLQDWYDTPSLWQPMQRGCFSRRWCIRTCATHPRWWNLSGAMALALAFLALSHSGSFITMMMIHSRTPSSMPELNSFK